VVGTPDPIWGERVHAVIVLHAGATVTEAELVAWSRGRIAGYKRPRSVSFIGDDEMPRTATGKIMHRVLKTRCSEPPP
jgi:fatty-acyl-CoA synthase